MEPVLAYLRMMVQMRPSVSQNWSRVSLPEDDGPDEAECKTGVAVDDIMGAHVLKVHSLVTQELKCLVHVLKAMDAHVAFRWARL